MENLRALFYSGGMSMNVGRVSSHKFKDGLFELVESVRLWPLWTFLAWQDVKLKYRRSVLGPWWITLSMSIFILSISTVYTRMFHQNFQSYAIFFTSGFLIWNFVSVTVSESTETFYSMRSMVKQVRLPYTMYLFRVICRNFIIFLHNSVALLLVLILARAPLSWTQLLALPGILMVLLTLFWVGLLISLVATRFRDIPPIVNTSIQILFLVSPITWMPSLLEGHAILYKVNPIYYMMDCVRSPILGHPPMLESWIVMSLLTSVGMLLSVTCFAKVRNSIAFWVG